MHKTNFLFFVLWFSDVYFCVFRCLFLRFSLLLFLYDFVRFSLFIFAFFIIFMIFYQCATDTPFTSSQSLGSGAS